MCGQARDRSIDSYNGSRNRQAVKSANLERLWSPNRDPQCRNLSRHVRRFTDRRTWQPLGD